MSWFANNFERDARGTDLGEKIGNFYFGCGAATLGLLGVAFLGVILVVSAAFNQLPTLMIVGGLVTLIVVIERTIARRQKQLIGGRQKNQKGVPKSYQSLIEPTVVETEKPRIQTPVKSPSWHVLTPAERLALQRENYARIQAYRENRSYDSSGGEVGDEKGYVEEKNSR